MVNALLADAALEAVVGDRIFWRYGPNGGLSKEEQPTAFDADEDVLPSLVVVKEERVRPLDNPKVDMLSGVQLMAVWAFQARGYDRIALALRAAHRVLHRAKLTPVSDPVNWLDCLWLSDSPELIDSSISAPVQVARFEVTLTDRLT